MGRRVLVTGGAGFIGTHLVERLLMPGSGVEQVRVLDDMSTGDPAGLAPGRQFHGERLEVVEGSILDLEALEPAMRGMDAVVHLAAITSVERSVSVPTQTHEVNATGTLRVLEAARFHGVRRVILASSAAVYGNSRSNEEDAPGVPASPYGASKAAAEAYMSAYAQTYGIEACVLRLFNVYGPGQRIDGPVVGRFVDQALRGQTLELHGDGHQRRELVHVWTVCDVIQRAVTADRWLSAPVNVAFGDHLSLRQLVAEIERQIGRSVQTQLVASRVGDIRYSGASGSRLRDVLSPEVEPIPLSQGLASLLREKTRMGQS